jgi:serine/threonine protein kinase
VINIQLEGYEILEKIGVGGMATIYKAMQTKLGRIVVLKFMDPALNEDKSFRDRFLREAKISAQLSHQNIVQIYDVVATEEFSYLSMEYVEGGDLFERLKTNIDLKTTKQLVNDMCAALDFAHGRNIVHRDVKSQNILIGRSENFLLADFGVAKATDFATQLTVAGSMVGSPKYMSPEQVRGEEVDGRSDYYSFAVVLFEVLTGDVPFRADSLVALVMKQVNEAIPNLPIKESHFQPFFNKALAKKPADRFQNGREFLTAFINCCDSKDENTVLFSQNDLDQNNKPILSPLQNFAPDPEQSSLDATVKLERKKPHLIWGVSSVVVVILVSYLAVYFYSNINNSSQKNTVNNTSKESIVVKPPLEIRNKAVDNTQQAIPAKENSLAQQGKLLRSIESSMIQIDGGTFKMGEKRSGMSDARPVHDVYVSSFWLSRSELTQHQYNMYLLLQGDTAQSGNSEFPVTNISWLDVQKFMNWLKKASGKSYRLPTESEWEYAAKAKIDTTYSWGNGIGNDKANCRECFSPKQPPKPMAVRSFDANQHGLYDIHGNVWEWVQDCYVANYKSTPTDGTAYEFDDCSRRVVRGGAFNSSAKELMPSYRNAAKATHSSATIGIRLARN